MKHIRAYIGLLIILVTVCTVFALDVRKSTPITFTGSYTLVVGTSHPNPFKLNAVTMTFGSAQTNILDISVKRSGSSLFHNVFRADGTYTTAEWILDGRGINLMLGDTLFFTNSVNTEQVELIYDYEI